MRIKKAKTWNEFNNECRKLDGVRYHHKTNLWTDIKHRFKGTYDGVSYEVRNIKTAETLLRYLSEVAFESSQNLQSILKEYLGLCYTHVQYDGGADGKLVGIEITEEDYYWIIANGDDEKYCSCVGGVKKYKYEA